MGKTFLYKDGKATLFMEDEVEAALADGYTDHPSKQFYENKKNGSVKKEKSVEQKALEKREKALEEKEKALNEKEKYLEELESLVEEDTTEMEPEDSEGDSGSGAVTEEQGKNE